MVRTLHHRRDVVRRRLAALLLICLSLPGALPGQNARPLSALTPPARLRVTLHGKRPQEATLLDRSGDTLRVLLHGSDGPVALRLDELSGLEVSMGRSRAVLRNAVTGLLAGVVGGALLATVTYREGEGGCMILCERDEVTIAGGIVGGTLGLVVGGALGLRRHDDWRTVSFTPRSASASGRTTLGIAVAF